MDVRYILFTGMNMHPNTILNAFFVLFIFVVEGCNHNDEYKSPKPIDSSMGKKELLKKCYDEMTIAGDKLLSFEYHSIQRMFGYYFNLPISSEISLNDELSVLEIDSAKVLLYTQNKNPNKVWAAERGLIKTIPKSQQVVIDSLERELLRNGSKHVDNMESLLSFGKWIDSLDEYMKKNNSEQTGDEKSLLSLFKWNCRNRGLGKIDVFFKDKSSNLDSVLYNYFMDNVFQ